VSLSRQAKGFERRRRRIAAQDKSRDPSLQPPDSGMTNGEFRSFRNAEHPQEKDADSAERLQRFLTGKIPLTDDDLSNWLDGLAGAISKRGGDARDKAARKEARRIIADLVKGARAVSEENPIDQNWDFYVDGINKAFAAREAGSKPEDMAMLDQYSAEHTARLLEREAPEPAQKGE